MKLLIFIVCNIAVFFIYSSYLPKDCENIDTKDWNTYPVYWYAIGTDKNGELALLLVPNFSRDIVSKYGNHPLEESEIRSIESEFSEKLPMAKIYEKSKFDFLTEDSLANKTHDNVLELVRSEIDELALEDRPITLGMQSINNAKCLKLKLPLGNNPDTYFYTVSGEDIVPITYCQQKYLSGGIVLVTIFLATPLAVVLILLFSWYQEFKKGCAKESLSDN